MNQQTTSVVSKRDGFLRNTVRNTKNHLLCLTTTHHFPFFIFIGLQCVASTITLKKKREKLLLMLLSKEIWFNHFWVRWGVNLAMCLCRYGPRAPSGSVQDKKKWKKGRRWPGSYSHAINADLFYFLPIGCLRFDVCFPMTHRWQETEK